MVCLLKDVQVLLKVRRTLRSVGTSSSNAYLFSWHCRKPCISRLPHHNLHTRSYRGIFWMYLWYSKKKGVNVGNPRHKNSRDRFCVCVTMTGRCRPKVPTFGCRGDMSPTCCQHSQPSTQEPTVSRTHNTQKTYNTVTMVPPSRRIPAAPILQLSAIAVRRAIDRDHRNMAM